MERIRLLLLDDHVLFRESLSRLLESEPDFEMSGHCGTGAEALELLRRAAVDAVKQWVYSPMTVNGHAVETSKEINLNFSLKQ